MDQTSESEAEFAAGKPVLDNSPFLWADTDYDKYRKFGSGPAVYPGANLADDDPITRRAQAWLDTLHAAVSARVQAQTGKPLVAPRPLAKIIQSDEVNAFVDSVPACAGGPVDLTGIPQTDGTGRASGASDAGVAAPDAGGDASGAADGGAPLSSFGFMMSPNAVWAGVTADQVCAPPKNWAHVQGAGPFYSRLHHAPCVFEERGNGLVVRGEKCGAVAAQAMPSVTQLVFPATPPYIHFTRKIVSLIDDEKAFAFVVAHELGHYYRAHGSQYETFNFWYEQKSPPAAGRPTPVADSDKLAMRLAGAREQLQAFHFPGEQVSPRLRFVVAAFGADIASSVAAAKASGTKSTVNEACASPTLYALTGGTIMAKLQQSLPLNASEKRTYAVAEPDLLKCAPSVNVPGPELPRDVVDAFGFWFPSIVELATRPGATLGSVMAGLQTEAATQDAASGAKEFIAELTQRHLGIYTTEEEADDYAMELLSYVGMSPKQTVQAWLDVTDGLAAHDESIFASDGIDHAQCKAQFVDGWTKLDDKGTRRPVFISLGNFDDPHHGFCFRLFNLSREVRAHRYPVRGTFPTFSPAWGEIRQAAATVLPPAPPPTAPPGAPPNALFRRGLKPLVDRY